MRLLALDHDCPLCVDGFQPAGIHPILGPVYIWCLADVICSGCAGHAVFPATALANLPHGWHLLDSAQTLTVCRVCQGIVRIATTAGGERP